MENIKALFEKSFSRALGGHGYNNEFITRFYTKFIGQSDEIAALFDDTNMSFQKTMLHDSISMMVEYYDSKELPIGLQKIAEIHNRSHKNIPEHMYDLWLKSMIDTVKEFDPEFDSEIENIWREVLSPGIDYMKSQY